MPHMVFRLREQQQQCESAPDVVEGYESEVLLSAFYLVLDHMEWMLRVRTRRRPHALFAVLVPRRRSSSSLRLQSQLERTDHGVLTRNLGRS
mmetsp:Transcript_64945/g.120899  ORF Transcript_64945/g.120899 Transcript_64945/m.120899 type:complete len:92 (-) Transcript_64945:140-415(-)